MEYKDVGTAVVAMIMKFIEIVNYVGAVVSLALFFGGAALFRWPVTAGYTNKKLPLIYGFSIDVSAGKLVQHTVLFKVFCAYGVVSFIAMAWSFHLLYKVLMSLAKKHAVRSSKSTKKDLQTSASLMLAVPALGIVMADVILFLQMRHMVPSFTMSQVSDGWIVLSLVIYGFSKHVEKPITS